MNTHIYTCTHIPTIHFTFLKSIQGYAHLLYIRSKARNDCNALFTRYRKETQIWKLLTTRMGKKDCNKEFKCHFVS